MKFWRNCTGAQEENSWTLDRYREEAIRVVDASWEVMHSAEWRLEKRSAIGDAYSAKPPGMNRIFKIKGTIDLDSKALLSLMFENPDDYPKWNPVIVECRLLERVHERAHVTYQVTSECLGGLVGRRDFVMLSTWAEREGALVLASVSVPHRDAPPPHTYIRAENRPGCYIIRPVDGEPSKSQVEWYLDANLKGWIPRKILDAAFGYMLMENLKNLKNYVSK